MMLLRFICYIVFATSICSCGIFKKDVLRLKGEEAHLKNIKQLTFGGDNAEAYWSFDSKYLTFQSNNKSWGLKCDQIFSIKAEEPNKVGGVFQTPKMISTGKGRTTCSYYMPDGKHILYASTHEFNENCPQEPEKTHGKYVWALYPSFDIYVADLSGKITQKLGESNSYDAEATVSPDGKLIVFTSTRTGDPELFIMNIDGSNVRQVTSELGYDGGAFFTPDSKQLIFRASRPSTHEAIAKYKELILKNLVEPTQMELFLVNIDGSNLKQLTQLGGANWAPFMHPSGKKVLFSSNYASKKGFPFNIYSLNLEDLSIEQITFDEVFASFPMFSPDGKKFVFCSNRNNGGTRDTNIFIGDWKD